MDAAQRAISARRGGESAFQVPDRMGPATLSVWGVDSAAKRLETTREQTKRPERRPHRSGNGFVAIKGVAKLSSSCIGQVGSAEGAGR